MKNYLGRSIILVENYDDAAQFYQTNFDFIPLFDVTTDVGQRFLHVGTEPTDSLGIWFLKAEGKEQRDRVGNQTGAQPTLVIYTTDLNQLYNRLTKNKVRIKSTPITTPEYAFFHCYDLYGNELVIVELDE